MPDIYIYIENILFSTDYQTYENKDYTVIIIEIHKKIFENVERIL